MLTNSRFQKHAQGFILFLILVALLGACQPAPTSISAPSQPADTVTAPPDTPIPPSPTPRPVTASDLAGIWQVKDVYLLQTADGKYGVAGSIARFVEREPEATFALEGNTIKLSNETGCGPSDVGMYGINLPEKGDTFELTLIEDPCEYRTGGPVPTANIYHRLAPLVLPGVYKSEVTQEEAGKAGASELLKYVGAWTLQLNTDGTYQLLQGDQVAVQGAYLSADIQFTLNHAEICPTAANAVYKAVVDNASVTFYKNTDFTRDYECAAMVLILTRHPWIKQ